MIELYHSAPNSMYCDDREEGYSDIPVIRVGVSDDFNDIAARFDLNQTLTPDDQNLLMALWILNDATLLMLDMMAHKLRTGSQDMSDIHMRWEDMVEDMNLPNSYGVVTDLQLPTSLKMPFGILAHSDGKIGGLTLSAAQTCAWNAAKQSGRTLPSFFEAHPLSEMRPGPEGAMLAMLPWRDEGLFHRAVMTGNPRLVCRSSFRGDPPAYRAA